MSPAPYPILNSTNLGSDLSQLLVYSNSVTGGLFMAFTFIAFFLIVFISSLVLQQRFTARMRPETSFLAASFASLGFILILSQVNNLIDPWYMGISIGLTILGFVWVIFSEQ